MNKHNTPHPPLDYPENCHSEECQWSDKEIVEESELSNLNLVKIISITVVACAIVGMSVFWYVSYQ